MSGDSTAAICSKAASSCCRAVSAASRFFSNRSGAGVLLGPLAAARRSNRRSSSSGLGIRPPCPEDGACAREQSLDGLFGAAGFRRDLLNRSLFPITPEQDKAVDLRQCAEDLARAHGEPLPVDLLVETQFRGVIGGIW